ncbi:hypothetical protein AQ436_12095 [Arthrobacter sp. EpRS66]|nr:hypothetical protein AQ436_12095 [Arthrobacter sp. EpRS66]
MARIPINAEMLKWALSDASLTSDDVASLVQKTLDEVESWVSGAVSPHKGDVEKIAKRVGRSVSFFFLRNPPLSTGPAAQFRSSVAGESKDSASELRALRQAGRAQKLLRWAAETEGHYAVSLPEPVEPPEVFADQVREFFEWDTAAQVRATSKSAVYRMLRERVEDAGIAVIFLDAGEENCRGFSLPDDNSPIIALNSAYRMASLKSFTLLHEFAHVAKGVAAVCHDPHRKEEQWCDAFAAAFLMPETHLKQYFQFKGWKNVAETQIQERIRLISNRYGASWQAVAIRLYRLGLAGQAVVDAVFEHSGEIDKGFAPGGGRKVPQIRLDEYGSTYTRAVLALRDENQLSELDARRYLRVDGAELSALKNLTQEAR